MHTRAVCKAERGFRLVNAAAVQPEFRFSDVSGTLVGFWTPAYARTLSIPGYHLHFLSADHTRGGTFSAALVRACAFNCNATATCRLPCRKRRTFSTGTSAAIPALTSPKRKESQNDLVENRQILRQDPFVAFNRIPCRRHKEDEHPIMDWPASTALLSIDNRGHSSFANHQLWST
jgi:hypothetical protein